MKNEYKKAKVTLWDLTVNQCATVEGDQMTNQQVKNRLNELGFSQGSQVTCVENIPFGGPKCFLTLRGEFALDKDVSENIFVSGVGEAKLWK